MNTEPVPAAFHEVTQSRYLNYALSVITARALPDVRDGLKPVQRRILYAMHSKLGLTPDAKHRKSAAVVGEVMAKLHPHGDQSIYDAMVRLAQDFSMRYPLVDGQGNFGSLDGDGAAAMRYTEARLRHLAVELLEEIRKDTVDFRANYDGTETEPSVLPAQVPNLLINGATGIAVGMATQIPPHHLGEILQALVMVLDRPDIPLEEVVGPVVLGPDFPTGGELLTDVEALRSIYATGHGTVEVRGQYDVEREGRRQQIILTSIPYAVNKSALVTEIADHIRGGRLPQVVDIRDESTEDIRVVLELQKDASVEATMAYLYRRTPLQSRFHVNMTALVPQEGTDVGAPRRMGLLEVLHSFLDFRLEVTRRRLTWEKLQLEKRIHLLRAFAIIFDALDEAIAIIRASRNRADARARLMERFELDEIQADAILDTRLYKLARLEIEAIRKELAEKEAARDEIIAILGSSERMRALVRGELEQIREAYADPRRTTPVEHAPTITFNEEDYIVDEDSVVMVTRDGWIKRQKSYSDLSAVRVREGDTLGWVLPSSTRETLVLFTDRGRAYSVRVADVLQTTGYGEAIQTRFDFVDGETLIGAAVTDPRVLPPIPEALREALGPDDPPPPWVASLTRKGRCLRLSLSLFSEPSTRTGRLFVRLDGDDDAAVMAELCHGREVMSIATRKGRCLLFSVDEVNVLGSPGKGVMAIKLLATDHVLGGTLTTDRMDGLVVETNRGRMETVRPNKFGVSARNNRGRELLRLGHLVRVLRPTVELRFREDGPDDAPPDAPPERLPHRDEVDFRLENPEPDS